ncbi:DUF3176 domain-containing protein [Aspergillus candidus]|uniref:Uncharacterized protein n=1 Tax=Aspergillus candidus TaxID=41067 RepID=A0A2I2FM21_ASPCN|nr:hypothetical protein BDW47DRAFT_133154 [Aspergillus candidus]PLB41687.1 hypothetical protein BDW47DRAFT_133154 [Aspergillus candidus]
MTRINNNTKTQAYAPAQVSDIGSEPLSGATTEYKRHPLYWPSEWLWESISSTLALGLLIGIAIIFWYMDDKPLSAWRGQVSLNTTIAILTTSCTAVLMHGVSAFIGQSKWLHFKDRSRKLTDFEVYDEASRGPWGAIQLLTTVKWNLATIGAFITILRLAFEPFTQQVVLIEQRDVISTAKAASFGYTHSYIRNTDFDLFNAGIESVRQDPGMVSAIFQGLYGINVTEPFICPGACRWKESYISLGFKAKCRDATQETLQSAKCGKDVSPRQCNMTTPGGLHVRTRGVATDSATTYYMNASSLLSTRTNSELPDTFPEITRFAIYRSTADQNFRVYDVNITDCSLYITAYEYSDAKANGSDFFIAKREIDFGVQNPWSFSNESRENYFDNMSTKRSKSGNIHIPALEISYTTLSAVEVFFESTSMASDWIAGNFINENIGVSAALYGDVDIGDRFDRMATAMTDHLRYGPNKKTAPGEVVHREPFVSIRWEYFVVPIFIEGLAILFAILSVFSNRQSRRVPLWKSSALAVLACQYEEQLGLLKTTGKDTNEIEADAEKAQAQLQ